MAIQRIRSSIALRTTLLVLGVALGIGLIANEIVGRIARHFETSRAQDRIMGLLLVVEPSASAACFVGDRSLAEEAAKGLLNSPSIARVEIWGSTGLLVKAQHPGRPAMGLEIVRQVPSPFSRNEVIGQIRVYPDSDDIEGIVRRYVWALRGLVLVLATVVGAALALAVRHSVIGPIKLLSDRLNGLEASRGMRLESPTGHEVDEIGRLVGNINEALEAVEERQRLEQQVQQAQAQKISSLGSLAGGVAHDFNNMLAGIMGYTDLLMAGEQNPVRQNYLRSILSASTRSSQLVAKLLAFGRRGKNRTEAVDLSLAVKECLSMILPLMHPDLRLVTDLEAGLSIDGDPSQIQQVLVNLCINAVEAMPEGGLLRISTRTVDVDGWEPSTRQLGVGAYAELKVSDTGPGISEHLLQQIFEPFYTTKTRDGETGTGLGLSMVYGIVESHHGAVDVESVVGRGSSFRVLLPQGQLSTEKAHSERTPGRGEGLILVVEDEPILQELAREALESLGYSVKIAQEGRAGVAAYATLHQKLRAVLLDLRMPIMGGKEAFEQMQRIDPSVPVIICTGYGENEEVQTILSKGGAGMLAKPYRIAELSEVLQRHLAVP